MFEKAGVNFSDVHGEMPPALAEKLPGKGSRFRAVGISLVLHPTNPFVPTVHANFRRIEKGDTGWFGGGADLTPYYVFDEDASHFHRTLKAACDAHEVSLYPRFKRWCDDYFFISHRNEPRGVGGLFFDYLGAGEEAAAGKEPTGRDVAAEVESKMSGSLYKFQGLDEAFRFVKRVGSSFLPAYMPIVKKRTPMPFGASQRDWQLVRRGRYVEFNLVYDRGTVFGLKTGGRIESILMSLPSDVRWVRPPAEPGTHEAETVAAICAQKDWASESAT